MLYETHSELCLIAGSFSFSHQFLRLNVGCWSAPIYTTYLSSLTFLWNFIYNAGWLCIALQCMYNVHVKVRRNEAQRERERKSVFSVIHRWKSQVKLTEWTTQIVATTFERKYKYTSLNISTLNVHCDKPLFCRMWASFLLYFSLLFYSLPPFWKNTKP